MESSAPLFVSPFAPSNACFENILLDELFIFEGHQATLQELFLRMKHNPFIMSADETKLNKVQIMSASQFLLQALLPYFSPTPNYSFWILYNSELQLCELKLK